ncbi:endonuclease/exonuclease/phosphatase family protein [Micromonospora arida]|uniref:endonuclease/exonuclease/phosphatase family protein n=1 Tax=Micromonospora arida TaxID=2203715 RepID=UPI0033BE445F
MHLLLRPAVALMVILAGAFVVAEPAAAALPSTVRTMTWNICGASANACKGTRSATEKINSIVQQVRSDPGISVIMIQEACAHLHSNPLASALSNATGATWHVSHRTARNITNGQAIECTFDGAGQRDAGVAVLMRGRSDEQIETFTQTFSSSPNPSASQGWACIKDRGNKIVACSVHLLRPEDDSDSAIKRASLRDMLTELRQWQDFYGYRTIVGGDFNIDDSESALDPLQAFAHEVDEDDNCNTTGLTCDYLGNKYDHIFYGRRAWLQSTGDVGSDGGGLSDHLRLIGQAAPRNQNEVNTAVAGTPPGGLPCVSNTYVTVCWENSGDRIWVRDDEADGKRAVAEWFAGANRTDYWRNGICNNSLGSGVWGQCNKDMVEGSEIGLRGTRLDGGVFADSTSMLYTIV